MLPHGVPEVTTPPLGSAETVGDLDAAISIYEQIINDPEAGQVYVAQALYRLGNCHLKLKQDAQAVKVLKRLRTQFPANKKLVSQAEKILDELLTLDPASLMPPETLYYAEVGSPGIQLEKILNMLKGTPFENPLAATFLFSLLSNISISLNKELEPTWSK